MTTSTDTQLATVADLVQYLRAQPRAFTNYATLTAGLDTAALDALRATVLLAEKASVLTVIAPAGAPMHLALTAWGADGADGYQPQPMFTLTYRTCHGPNERVQTADGIERIGALVMRLADRDLATDIEVRDENGTEVTFNFRCFS